MKKKQPTKLIMYREVSLDKWLKGLKEQYEFCEFSNFDSDSINLLLGYVSSITSLEKL